MRLARVSLSAIGVAVMPIDPHQSSFSDAIISYASKSISGITSQVDATLSDLGNTIPVSISRTTTTITVVFPSTNPHTLGSNVDYVVISGTGNALLDGQWPVASVTDDVTLTLTSPTSGTIAATVGYAVPIRRCSVVIASATPAITVSIPTVTAALPLYTLPFSALILKCTAWTAGTVYLDVRQSGIC